MLSRFFSALVLRLLAAVTRRLGRPLLHYFSFSRQRPFLSVGLTGFTVKLEQLQLLQSGWNEELLKASLPLQLHSALIESLTVHCGLWSAVRVEVKGAYLLFKTATNKHFDADIERKNALELKRKRLQGMHFTGEEVPVKKPGWIQSLISKLGRSFFFILIKRFEVSISGVHLRVEDELSQPEEPVAAGVVVDSLAIRNAEAQKEVELRSASAYCNCGQNWELFSHSSEMTATAKLQAFPVEDALGCDYVVKPIAVRGDLLLERGRLSYLEITLSLRAGSFSGNFSKQQLSSIMKLLAFFKQQQQIRCFLQFRPPVQPTSEDSTRQWWIYAFKCVVKYLRGKKGRTVWEQLSLHRSLYKEYSQLYEMSLTGKKLSKREQLRMKVIEEDMELMEIMACRSKVWKALRLRRLLCDHLFNDKKKPKKVSKEVLVIKPTEESLLCLSLTCQCENMEVQLTDAFPEHQQTSSIMSLAGQGLSLDLSLHHDVSSVQMEISSFTLSGSAYDSREAPKLLYQPPRARAPPMQPSNQPVLAGKLGMSHKDHTPSNGWLSRRPSTASQSDFYDHHLLFKLQPMVFIFDKETALRLTDLGATLYNSFNTEDLKFYLKEQAHELKYQGEKMIEEAFSNHEIMNISADVHLPLLIIPASTIHTNSDVAIKLGQLQVATLLEKNTEEVHKVKYMAGLSGTVIALNLQDVPWRKPGSEDFTFGNSKLLSCPKIEGGVTAAYLSFQSTPRVILDGNIPSIDFGLSNASMDAVTKAASSHIKTLLDLRGMVTEAGQHGDRHVPLYSYVSRTELTDSRLAEVAKEINGSGSVISKHSLEGCKEEVDGGPGSQITPDKDLPMLQISFLLTEVSLELTSEVQTFLNNLDCKVQGLQLNLEKSKDNSKCRINLSSISVVDSSTNSSGFEVRPAYPVLLTQSIGENGFLAARMHNAISDADLLKQHSVRTSVSVDMGPLSLSLLDAALFSWMEIFVGYHMLLRSVDVERLRDQLFATPKSSPPKSALTKSAVKDPQSQGVTNLEVRLFSAEVVVSLLARSVPVTKLTVSGIHADLKDTAASMECDASVDALLLLDCLQEDGTHSKVLSSNPSEKVLKFKCSRKKTTSSHPRTIVKASSRPQLHPDALTAALRADITVGGLSCTVLFSFITVLQGFLRRVAEEVMKKIAVLNRASESSAALSATPTATPFKYHLSVNVHSVSVMLPRSSGAMEAVKLKLDSMLLSNKYTRGSELSGDGAESYLPVMETIQLDFHQLSVSRFVGEETFELGGLPELNVTLTRLLPTGIPARALSSEPHLKATVVVPKLEMFASNHDLCAVFLIVQGNFGEESLMAFEETKPLISIEDGKEENADIDKSSEPGESGDATEEGVREEVGPRKLLQLDASFNELKWTLQYIQSGTGHPLPGKQLQVVIAELKVSEVFSLVDVESNGSVSGEAWVMDATMKELPVNHSYNSLEGNEAYILYQELYYRKTKPPKLDGGTMDTRRSSPDDVLLKASFSYSKDGIKVGLTIQHVHMCLWPQLITPFLSLRPNALSPATKSSKPAERQPPEPRQGLGINLVVKMDNISVALLDKPSNVTSHGICTEVVSPDCQPISSVKLTLSPSGDVEVSSSALHFEASVIEFGKKISKLVQVVDPLSLDLSYSMSKHDKESKELAKIAASPIVVSLSMETIFTILKPVYKIMRSNSQEQIKPLKRTSSKLEDIWGLKEVVREVVPLDRDLLGTDVAVEGEEGDTRADEESEVFEGTGDLVKQQRAELCLPLVVLNFDVVSGGSSHTLLSLTSMLEAAATSWSAMIEVDAKLELSGFVHNQRVAAWEPLLEPLESVGSEYRHWAVIGKVRHIDSDAEFNPIHRNSIQSSSASGGSPAAGRSSREDSTASEALTEFVTPLLGERASAKEETPSLSDRAKEKNHSLVLLISCDDRLEVTLSPGALETLLMIVEASRLEESVLDKNLAACSYFTTKPMQIRNQTGLDVTVFPGPTFTIGNSLFSNRIDLSPGEPILEPPDTPTIVSALAEVTTAVLGNKEEGASDKGRSSVAKLHYADRYSRKRRDGCIEEEVDGGEEDVVTEEWDGLVRHHLVMSGGNHDIQAKTNSLTLLRNRLQEHYPETDQDVRDSHLSSLAASYSKAFSNKNLRQSAHHRISIQAKGGKKSHPIPVSLPGLIPIPLFDQSFGGLGYGKKLVGLCEIENLGGVRRVTIRSAVQVRNDYPYSVTLYQHSDQGTHQLTMLQPGQVFSLPVPLYMEKTPLKIGVGEKSLFGEDVLDWSSMLDDLENPVYISCPVDTSSRTKKYYMQALGSLQQVATDLNLLNSQFLLISLKPTLVFHNLLPITVRVTGKESERSQEPAVSIVLKPGVSESLNFIDPSKEQKLSIEIPEYKGAQWTGLLEIEATSEYRNHLRVKLLRADGAGEYTKMKIGVYSDKTAPSLFHLYCPYWVCNKSGLRMEYEYYSRTLHSVKGITDDGTNNSITLVFFKHNMENRDKKLRVRVGHDGHLSRNIFLGNTGEAVEVAAKSKNGTVHELVVQKSFSLHVLTQIVHILPKYVVQNLTKVKVRVSSYFEKIKEDHIVLDSNEVRAFWPNAHKAAILHFQNTTEPDKWVHSTMPFSLDKIGSISLPLSPGNQLLSAVTVKVSPDPSGSLILVTINPYFEGSAVLRLENFSRKITLKIRQSGGSSTVLVPVGNSKLYSWDDPLLQWQLQWQVLGENSNSWVPLKDSVAHGNREVVLVEEEGGTGGGDRYERVWWRVAYDGLQKVFQLFDSEEEYKQADEEFGVPPLSRVLSKEGSMKASSVQVFCSLEGVGLSLLNNEPVEVLYCSIQSSPVVWLKRNRQGGKFRVLEESQLHLDLEGSWRTGVPEIEIESEVFNLSSLKGNRGGTLMRSFNPGLWASFSMTGSQFILSAKVGQVQVDNQLQDHKLERVVLAAELAHSSESVIAPMVDAAVIISRPNARQPITFFEDAYVKVKNLQVNVELGVVAAIIPLVQPLLHMQGLQEADKELYAYSSLSSAVSKSLKETFLRDALSIESSNRFKSLAISPIKITVVYTTIVAGPYNLSNVLGNVIDFIVHFSVAVGNGSLDIKLESFKFTGDTVSMAELYAILFSHYRNEVLGSIHSALFGLDIIGNPSKLLGNIETGLKELIDEAEEGFEKHSRGSGVVGVAVGVKDLLGHVVEGSSESLGTATGSFRNTLLETTDLDYRRRHRLLENEASETLAANLLLGTRFFAEGIVGGLTDIFRQPISGAGASGAKGFFHGLGKGALSILTKPTLGVVDLAYFTLEGIRSFADEDQELQPVRLPRLIRPNKIVTPYNVHEAQGLNILWRNPDNSKDTQYYGHHWLPTEKGEDPKLLFINSLSVLKLKRSGKLFKADDLNAKLEYMQEWKVVTENDGSTFLFLKYGDDGKLEKFTSFLGFSKTDHHAEVTDKTAMVIVDSPETGTFLVKRITEACRGVLVYYAKLMASSK